MQNTNDLTNALNDLIQINRDRIEGYRTAQDDIQEIDIDLHALFGQKIGQSEDFISELANMVVKYGATPETDSTMMGKMYRSWMDFKATLTREDRESILNSCSFGERAALEEYDDVLKSSTEIPSDIRQTIMNQRDKIKASQETIEKYSQVHEGLDQGLDRGF